jgi:hypothetical protein
LKDLVLALVQMAVPDQLGWCVELAEVVDGQAEGGSGAVQVGVARIGEEFVPIVSQFCTPHVFLP